MTAPAHRRAPGAFARVMRHHRAVMLTGGAMLILVGLLLVTGPWSDTATVMQVWTATFTAVI